MLFLSPSQKRFLSSLNPLLLGGLVYLLIIVRTATDPILPSILRQWDLLLPFVVYVGQRRTLIEGILLVLFISHLFSLASVAPIGVFAVYYLALFFLARLLVYAVFANTWVTILGVLFLVSIVSRILLPLVTFFFGFTWSLLSFKNVMVGSFFVNAILGLFFYLVLSLVDRLTFKVNAISIELLEGEV